MNAFSPITPRAFDAIVAQITPKADREMFCYATVDGEQVEWTAFFEEEQDAYYGVNENNRAATRCRLVGAYDSECTIAANRDELLALLGEAVVTRWEAYAEERANG